MSKRKMSRKPSYVFASDDEDDDFVGAKPKRNKPTKAKNRKEANKENSPLQIDKSATKKVRERLASLSSSGDNAYAPSKRVAVPITIIDSDSDFSENCPSQKENAPPAPKSSIEDKTSQQPDTCLSGTPEETDLKPSKMLSKPSPESAESDTKSSGEEFEDPGSGSPSPEKGIQSKETSTANASPPFTAPAAGSSPKSRIPVQPDTRPKKMTPVFKSSTVKPVITSKSSKPVISASSKATVTPTPSKSLSKEASSTRPPACVPYRNSTPGSFQGTPIKLGLSKSAKLKTLHNIVKR